MEEVSASIVEAIHWRSWSGRRPELTGDISTNGIVMTGGGALVWGFDKLVAVQDRHPDPRRGRCDLVRRATARASCLEHLSETMQDGTMNLSRQRQMMQ